MQVDTLTATTHAFEMRMFMPKYRRCRRFYALSQGSRHQVPQLRRWLSEIPVPSGAVLVTENAYEANGDASAYVGRQHRLPAAPSPSQQVRGALISASVVLVYDGTRVPVAAAPWSRWTSPTSGDLYALPPDTDGTGVEVNGNGRTLTLSVQPGNVHN